MRRVAIVYPYIAHYREAVFERLVCALDSSNHKYQFFAFSDFESNLASLSLVDPVKSEGLGGAWRWSRIKNLWWKNLLIWQKGLFSKVVFSRSFDDVIFLGNAYYINVWVATLFLKLRKKRVFYWTHGVRVKDSGIKKYIRIFFYKMADGLLLYGDKAKKLLCEEGISQKKIFVIYNSMDYEKQKKVRESLLSSEIKVFSDFDLRVIYTGRLTKEKGLDVVISAIGVLKEKGKSVFLRIVGGGEDLARLRKLVDHLSISDRVLFSGPCYDENELGRFFLSSDLCVVPSAAGLSVMHAMAFGLPVITNDDFSKHGPEAEAIEEGITGAFYKAGCLDSLIEKIIEWGCKVKADRSGLVKNRCIEKIERCYTAERQVELMCTALNCNLEK